MLRDHPQRGFRMTIEKESIYPISKLVGCVSDLLTQQITPSLAEPVEAMKVFSM
jgi:hypothetical protein